MVVDVASKDRGGGGTDIVCRDRDRGCWMELSGTRCDWATDCDPTKIYVCAASSLCVHVWTHTTHVPPRSEPAREARELALAVRGMEERKGSPPSPSPPPAAVEREDVEVETWEVSRYDEGCWCWCGCLEPPRKPLLAVDADAVLGAPAVCVCGRRGTTSIEERPASHSVSQSVSRIETHSCKTSPTVHPTLILLHRLTIVVLVPPVVVVMMVMVVVLARPQTPLKDKTAAATGHHHRLVLRKSDVVSGRGEWEAEGGGGLVEEGAVQGLRLGVASEC